MDPSSTTSNSSGEHVKYPNLLREAEIASQDNKNVGNSLWEPFKVTDKKRARRGLTNHSQNDRLGQRHSQE